MQHKAQQVGVDLDIGELPPLARANPDGDDPERLAKLVAHAVARIGDRFAFVRKVSRHLEGSDKRAGLLSDLSSAALELYQRNPEAIKIIGRQYAQAVADKRAAKPQQPFPVANHNQPTGVR